MGIYFHKIFAIHEIEQLIKIISLYNVLQKAKEQDHFLIVDSEWKETAASIVKWLDKIS